MDVVKFNHNPGKDESKAIRWIQLFIEMGKAHHHLKKILPLKLVL